MFDSISKGFGGRRFRPSYDMKLTYAYFVPMMVLFAGTSMVGTTLPLPLLLAISCGLFGVLASLSVLHKKKHGWRWPGLTAGRVAIGALNVLWGIVVLVSAAGFMLPPEERPWRQDGLPAILEASWDVFLRALALPGLGPFLLFGAGIIVLNTLYALRLMEMYEDDFRKHCSDDTTPGIQDAVDAAAEYGPEPTILGLKASAFDKPLRPLCFIAGSGFLLSVMVHVFGLLGTDLGRVFPPIWLLHVGVFVVWFPAVMIASLSQPRPHLNDFWKVVTKHTPLWMRILCIVLFPYVIISFMYRMDRTTASTPEQPAREHVETVEEDAEPAATTTQRSADFPAFMFSGHWMIFYLVGWTILLSYWNKRKMERLPPPIPSVRAADAE